MRELFALIILAMWAIGTGWRVYKQARFYQIEEYKSDRYLLWLSKDRTRWLLTKPILLVMAGAIGTFFVDSIPSGFSLMPALIAVGTGFWAILPPDEGIIKKKFVSTPRARRLLMTAFVIVFLVFALVSAGVLSRTWESDRLLAILMSLSGVSLFLLAPAWLMLANVCMTPVEALLRQRFIGRAKSVLQAVNPKVIGITGSYGKTTTKNYIRELLNGRYKAYATPKSYNTVMGVCIAINNDLADDYSIDYFISEMGAYVQGEIQRICDLTPPAIGVIVEVGPQHLERFGTLDNIAKAKYELIKNVSPDGLGVFNWDNPYVREMFERGYPQHRIAVSRMIPVQDAKNGVPRLIATDVVETLNGLSFRITDTITGENEAFNTPLVGEHNVTNVLLAAAVALHEGISLKQSATRAHLLHPAESRLVRQPNENGTTIINDAYSANPVGVISSLKVLGMYTQGRRVLVTPGMIELGDMHYDENYKLGVLATQYATDIFLVGEKQTQPIQDGVKSTPFPPEHLHIVTHVNDALAWVKSTLGADDTVLLLNDLPDTY